VFLQIKMTCTHGAYSGGCSTKFETSRKYLLRLPRPGRKDRRSAQTILSVYSNQLVRVIVRSATPTEAAFRDAVERMRVSTRQYAKRQVSWIRNKLLPAVRKANAQISNCAPAYLLDATGKLVVDK
jgi:hypothetical protein